MDLGTIAKKLAKDGSGGYTDHNEFAADVQLVFDNAMKYNGSVSVFWGVRGGRNIAKLSIFKLLECLFRLHPETDQTIGETFFFFTLEKLRQKLEDE